MNTDFENAKWTNHLIPIRTVYLSECLEGPLLDFTGNIIQFLLSLNGRGLALPCAYANGGLHWDTQNGPAQISLYVQVSLTENGETIPMSQSDHDQNGNRNTSAENAFEVCVRKISETTKNRQNWNPTIPTPFSEKPIWCCEWHFMRWVPRARHAQTGQLSWNHLASFRPGHTLYIDIWTICAHNMTWHEMR